MQTDSTWSSARLWNLPRLNEAKSHVDTGPRAKLRLSLGKVRGDRAARRIPCHPATLLRSHPGRIKNEKVLVKQKRGRSVQMYIGLAYPVKTAVKWKRPENILGHFCLHYRDLLHRSSDRIGNIVRQQRWAVTKYFYWSTALKYTFFFPRVSLLDWSICFFGNFHSTAFQCWMSTMFFWRLSVRVAFKRSFEGICFKMRHNYFVSWSSSPRDSSGVAAACRFWDEAR